MRKYVLCLISLSLLVSSVCNAEVARDKDAGPWWGHEFVFVFATDDGTACNMGWAEKAMEMDFRFSMAVNADKIGLADKLTPAELDFLLGEGFEMSNHSTSHANHGMIRCTGDLEPPFCDPLFGNLRGYFEVGCSFTSPEEGMSCFYQEISTLPIENLIDPQYEGRVKTFMFPRHGHSRAITDSLMVNGYIGARAGLGELYSLYSDYSAPPANSWDGGISLYRVPLMTNSAILFGDHGADPPVHFDYETFQAAAMPLIQAAKDSNSIAVLYTHHFGDDADCHGTWSYGSGGITPEELEWMIDLVRAHGGIVKTFEEAVTYYRSKSIMTMRDGDPVWVPAYSSAPEETPEPNLFQGLTAYPNPFNPVTTISFELATDIELEWGIYDLRGRQILSSAKRQYPAGQNQIQWRGNDSAGRIQPSGVYFFVLNQGQKKSALKLLLSK